MSTTTEITRLRKAGQLEAASTLAQELLAQQPGDRWVQQAYGWVLYAQAKQHLEADAAAAARACLAAFDALGLPPEEALLHERFGYVRVQADERVQQAAALSKAKQYREALQILWRIFRREPALAAVPALHAKLGWEIWHLLRALPAEPQAAWRQVAGLAGMYRQLSLLPRPSLGHSMVLSELLRLPPGLRERFDFLDWFRFWKIPDDFEERDWQPYLAEGRSYPSMAEKACNAWCKALANARHLPAEELEEALARIEAVAQQQPAFVWLPYYLGKIRIAHSASLAAAREALLPFVRHKHTEFWAWDLLADTWAGPSPEEQAQREACWCRALLCRTEPQFLVKVRLRLAQALAAREAWAEAKYEIEEVIALKTARKEQVPGTARLWSQAPWYAAAEKPARGAQLDYYRQQAAAAEALVFAENLREGVGVIEHIDQNTGTAYFALEPEVRGRFALRRFRKLSFAPGDFLRLRLLKVEKHGRAFWEVLSLEQTDEWPVKEICRRFEGPFRQFGQHPVGTVGKAFVPAALARALGLRDGEPAAVRAVWAFDVKREQWGWKAVGKATWMP
jgi:predicted Zn-dependent protease